MDSVEGAAREIRKMLSLDPDGTRPGAGSGRPPRSSRPAPPLASTETEGSAGNDPVEGALEVWRAARRELARVEERLEARTRELGLLQTLGRKAAEAHSVPELFRVASETLQESLNPEMILIVHLDEPSPKAECYLVRPASLDVRAQVARFSGERIGRELPEGLEVQVRKLASWDESHWSLRTVQERDLTMLPILRRGTAIACLTLAHSRPPREGTIRLLHGAANQLSTHMDRILTVREAEQDRFRAILECMPQGVILLDREFRPVHVNPAARRLLDPFGLGRDSTPVKTLERLDLAILAERAVSAGEGSSETEWRLPLGETWNVTASAVQDEAGRVEGWVYVFTDLTESRRLQDQLAQAEKMSSLGQMISGVAHELNNPLASILGYAQLLQAAPPEKKEDLTARLRIMNQEAGRCQKIVRNLLSFARRGDSKKKLFSLNEKILSVQALLHYQLRMDDVEIVPETDPELPVLSGDDHQIQQAVLNLVTNAHHALKEAGRGGRIRIRTRRLDENEILLEVEDDGPGIPPEIRGRIFDPFFTTKPPGKGTGLGLSLVYGAITSQGGTVKCVDSESGGACFRIRLPVGGTGTEEPGKREPGTKLPPAKSCRVLVVDDENTVAGLMKAILEEEGHQVAVAGSGREALECLEQESFRLAVIDYRMPGLSGIRLCEEIRERFGAERVRLLLTSGDTVSGEPETVAGRLGTSLLQKPFRMEEFQAEVRRCLRGEAAGGT